MLLFDLWLQVSQNFTVDCTSVLMIVVVHSVVSDSATPWTPGFPVLHYLPEPAHTHVHRVGDAIQPSHPLSSLSLPALNLSQHRGLPIMHVL